jgi:hypothetical protein
VRLKVNCTSVSSGAPGAPVRTRIRREPIARSWVSPTLILRLEDSGTGGLQEACARGGPWVRFGEVQGLNAVTSEA